MKLFDKLKESAGKVADVSQSAFKGTRDFVESNVNLDKIKDGVSSLVDKTKEGASTLADKTKEGASTLAGKLPGKEAVLEKMDGIKDFAAKTLKRK